MAINSITEWASKQPDWQQDALRRVALSSEIEDLDTSAILANLKLATGLRQEGELVSQPFTKDHLQPDAQTVPLAHLCSIDNVKNVNRLAPNQKLTFALDGITLIYGHNGSGKSGYCRILKKFCRTIVKDTIHPDVFATGNSPPAEARIRFKLEGATDVSDSTWQDGEEGPGDVAHLSVFDSHNARLYVDERNRIDYLPYEIELLMRFAQLLTNLQEKLSTEIIQVNYRLNVHLPTGFTPGTAVSELIDRLKSKTPIATLPKNKEIDALGMWTDALEQNLKALQQTMNNDPVLLAERCRRVRGILSGLVEELTTRRNALSQAKAMELKQAVSYARVTAEAASLAATTLFKDEPLPEVGSDPWQLMFQHAKEYSKLAYPEVEPPATRDSDLCVLCQQPLTEEAAERLHRFENYVVSEAKKNAEKAAAVRDEKSATIKAVHLRSTEDAKSLLGEFAGLSDTRAKTAADVEKFIKAAHERKKKLLAAVESGDFSVIAEFNGSVIDQLRAEMQVLADEAASHDGVSEDDIERERQRLELTTLLDRKRLSGNLETIRARRDDIELKARLQKCVSATKTNAVSLQVRALRKELVTEGLNNRILAETDALDLKYIPLVVNDDSRKGESLFEVRLEAQHKVTSRDVLSEGEQRALGLACFLADVNGQPVNHGIIVDDPVSSLDHIRIRRVADRLVREAAKGRQVIIFTHSLPFFFEVGSLAAAHTPDSVPVLTNVIRKEAERVFGIIEKESEPWVAKRTTKRIEFLEDKIKKLKTLADKDDENYRQMVTEFFTGLRETWERLVEEVLLCKVVERFGTDVKTQSLKGVEVTDKDYKTIYWAMKGASERSGHDMAPQKNIPLPKIEDLKKDLKNLKEFHSSLKQQSKDASIRRAKFEKPPEATTA